MEDENVVIRMSHRGMRPSWVSAVVAVFILSGCRHVPSRDDNLIALQRALSLPAANGQFDPRVLQDKVVLVTFLATWCFPCLGQIPLLKKLQAEHGPNGFHVVAVGLDREGEKVLTPFAEFYELPFPLLVADETFRSGGSAFGAVPTVPTTVIFSREGAAIATYSGLIDAEKLESLIAKTVSR